MQERDRKLLRPEVSPNEDTKKSLKCKVITKDQSVKDAIPFSLYWQIHKKIVVRTKNGITHLELIGFPVPVLVRLPANRPIFSSATFWRQKLTYRALTILFSNARAWPEVKACNRKLAQCKGITKDTFFFPEKANYVTLFSHLELIGFPVPVLVRLPANRPIFSSAQRGSTSIYQAHFRRQDIFLIESVVHQRLPPLWPLIQAYRQGHLRLTGFSAK